MGHSSQMLLMPSNTSLVYSAQVLGWVRAGRRAFEQLNRIDHAPEDTTVCDQQPLALMRMVEEEVAS